MAVVSSTVAPLWSGFLTRLEDGMSELTSANWQEFEALRARYQTLCSTGFSLIQLESIMTVYVIAFVIGVVAGLRTMTAFAAISWAAYFGWVNLGGSWLEFLGSVWTATILTVLALGELVSDQLPSTPSRTVPVQFGGRIFVGAVAGTAVGVPSHAWMASALTGVVGAIVGTLVGKEFRTRLASALNVDRPAAFIEDAIAICFAFLVVLALL
jgi:uncharacterized membrane protein